MPCTDVDVSKKYASIKSEISAGCPANPHEEETCTPFCVCLCCGSTAINLQVVQEIVAAEFEYKNIFQTEIVKVKKVSFSIWQPPKVS